MSEMFVRYTTRWWRFTDYEIQPAGSGGLSAEDWARHGLIRPAAGADLVEYDPWEEYLKSRTRGSAIEPAHQTFVSLSERISFDINRKLRPDSAEAILTWCRRYGLLGAVPQFYMSLPAGTREIVSLDQKVVCPFAHVRVAGSWRTREQEGPVIAAGLRNAVVARPDLLNRYFPGVEDAERIETTAEGYRAIPYLPLTEEFWRIYGEPVSVFGAFARNLGLTIKRLTSTPLRSSGREPGQLDRPECGLGFPRLRGRGVLGFQVVP